MDMCFSWIAPVGGVKSYQFTATTADHCGVLHESQQYSNFSSLWTYTVGQIQMSKL